VERFVLRLPASLYAKLTHLAEAGDASINDVMLLALRDWIAGPPRRTPAGLRARLTASSR
jgi:hypothetical protein